MTSPSDLPERPPLEELALLHDLNRAVDELLEESLKARETVSQTFRRAFPQILQLTGARAIAVTAQNEELIEQTWFEGPFGGRFPGLLLAEHPDGVVRLGDGTLFTQPLDVVGMKVGTIGLLYEGDRTRLPDAAAGARVLDVIAEQLDNVLVMLQTAAEKHQLILQFNQLLSNPVFEVGMDQAVLALAQRVRLPGFMLVYRDAVQTAILHYRIYKNGHLLQESREQPSAPLDALIQRRGVELVRPANAELKAAVGGGRTAEAVLISGTGQTEPLGKVLVWADDDQEGFSAFAMDLIRVLATTLTQRLLDYNRERIHLSQFFAAHVIDELLRDPRYRTTYLTPRDEEVGILFADINGFTRICEEVLESPSRIGRFVDRWSDGVVRILWEHGGVFDKMVGDCVIGLFGPPFFRTDRRERAAAAVRAACAIQSFTQTMSSDPEVRRISETVQLPGLGVAIGVNLAHSYCGVFGPNQQYTAFSTGMNQAARLQALGGFREVLVMESVREALDGYLEGLGYGPLTETPVKNLAQPLRHRRLTWTGS